MNKLLLIVFLAVFAVTGYSQSSSAWGWGKVNNSQLSFGKIFPKTDSLYHVDTPATIDTSDTVYSDIFYTNSEGPGVFVLALSVDSSDATSDSVYFDIRDYYDKNIHTKPWGTWKNIGGPHVTNYAYPYTYDIADCTWYHATTGWQLRAYRRDTAKDTCLVPNVGVYGN